MRARMLQYFRFVQVRVSARLHPEPRRADLQRRGRVRHRAEPVPAGLRQHGGQLHLRLPPGLQADRGSVHRY